MTERRVRRFWEYAERMQNLKHDCDDSEGDAKHDEKACD
jgi:hypothetical protein